MKAVLSVGTHEDWVTENQEKLRQTDSECRLRKGPEHHNKRYTHPNSKCINPLTNKQHTHTRVMQTSLYS